MRRSVARWCSRSDLSGTPSRYYPRFRPRRLVMPVDPNDVHSSRRQGNPLLERHRKQLRLRRSAERRGAITLSSVPAERSVGDAYRIMLEVCEQNKLFDTQNALAPDHMLRLAKLMEQWEAEQLRVHGDDSSGERDTGLESSPHSRFYQLALDMDRDAARLPLPVDTARESDGLSVRQVDRLWAALDATSLNSPVHGALAQRGKCLVEATLARLANSTYPRLRSVHLQQLLHETCGLLPCGRVAVRLGFARVAAVEAEIGMWRELNILTERFSTARRKAAAHLQRMDKGITQQRRWYWRAVLRAAAGRLKLFPVEMGDLQPRMEWIRSSIFAFIAFVELAERSGEVGIRTEPLIHKLFIAQLGSFAYATRLVEAAHRAVDGCPTSAPHAKADERSSERCTTLRHEIQEELLRIRRLSTETDVLERQVHPMNARADRKREQFESSGGAHAVQTLRDDIFDDFQVTRHQEQAPAIVVHALRTANALKEAQLILKYDPNVPPHLKEVPLDVEQVIRRTVEVHETNPYATLSQVQQYRQVEYTVCRLFAGKRCVGEGKGETLMEAMQEAAQHLVLNYYLRHPPAAGSLGCQGATVEPEEQLTKGNETPSATMGGKVRVQDPRTEEEIVF